MATGGRFQAHDILSFSLVETSVDIDIIPGSGPNSINCENERRTIRVAILSTKDFNATKMNANSVRFGKTGTEASEVHRDEGGKAERHVADVNNDDRRDLVFYFRLEDTSFSCNDVPAGEESITLAAKLTGAAEGKPFAGQDTLQLVRQND